MAPIFPKIKFLDSKTEIPSHRGVLLEDVVPIAPETPLQMAKQSSRFNSSFQDKSVNCGVSIPP